MGPKEAGQSGVGDSHGIRPGEPAHILTLAARGRGPIVAVDGQDVPQV
jgi:hypothetical protein